VTVRSRGVMEKCTYCVQRIRTGQIQAEIAGTPIRDGDVRSACQQACPTQAIVFGDMNDPNSEVAKRKTLPLDYSLLAELNTKPRTTYLAALRNPNPALEAEAPVAGVDRREPPAFPEKAGGPAASNPATRSMRLDNNQAEAEPA
jgi:molybdopterin-containing oxidoreductase family iron-sulfur binding subunit